MQGPFYYSANVPGLQQYKRNTVVGDSAAYLTYGNDNSALGFQSLVNNSNGNSNTAIGNNSMITNTTGSFNTALGSRADVASNNLTNATAIGYRAQVGQSNCLVLGSINGVNAATSNTNVGIGITNPTFPLTVLNTTSPTTVNAGHFVSNNSSNYASNGATVYAQNTYAGNSDVVAVMGKSLFTSNGTGYGGYFQGNGTGVFGEASPGATVGALSTYGIRGQAAGATAANNYGIYGVATSGASNYGVYGYASGGTSWAGYFNGAVFGTGYTTSDAKLKRDFTGLDNAIEKVMQLKPMSYYYDVKKFPSLVLPETQQTGFIAQDVEKIFPALVKEALQPAVYENGDSKGRKISAEVPFKALNYTGLIPVLTKAIQEQQGIITQQQQQINNQQKNIEDLLKRIEKLETK